MVQIITDSSSEFLEQDYIDLEVIPLHLVISEGEKEYQDGKDISGKELFKAIKEGREFKSAQVPYIDYLLLFEELASQGQAFIYLSISSGISGSFSTASLAVEELRGAYPQLDMAVVDSRAASVGQGLMATKLAKAAKQGKIFDDLMELASFLQKHIRHGLIVSDLDYLSKGGRLKKSEVILGSLMGIQPLITFDPQGNLVAKDKTRGRKKAYRILLNQALEESEGPYELAIVYNEKKSLEQFLQSVDELIPSAKKHIRFLGCAIGVHTGPDTLGFAYLTKEVPQHLIS